MKVLQLIQKPQLRGAEIFASQLSAHISQSGNTAILVSLFEGEAALPFDGTRTSLQGNPKGRLLDIRAWKKLAEIIEDTKPDIIQANAGDTLKYAVFSKLLYRWKQPIVFRNASTISLYIKSMPKRIWNNFLFSFTDKIISVSKTSAADFAKLFPKQKHKIITIPIGIEHETLSKPHHGTVTTRSQMNGHPLQIVHVGGFTFEKNHAELIEIFELVLKKKAHAILNLVGDGPLKLKTEELVASKGLTTNVKFHGFQKNPLHFIRSADVLVLPSIIEGLPGVVLEAFYCKTPVVAYDVGGIKEVVKNKETGRLITQGDKDAFAVAILESAVHSPLNEKLIENAHRLVLSDYLNSKVVKQFITAYESLVS